MSSLQYDVFFLHMNCCLNKPAKIEVKNNNNWTKFHGREAGLIRSLWIFFSRGDIFGKKAILRKTQKYLMQKLPCLQYSVFHWKVNQSFDLYFANNWWKGQISKQKQCGSFLLEIKTKLSFFRLASLGLSFK